MIYQVGACLTTRKISTERVFNRVQRIGGQAVVGCFRTVGAAVAEAEANMSTTEERHLRKALKMWVDLHSMPDTHPLAPLIRRRTYKRFASPMQKIAEAAQGAPVDEVGGDATLHLGSVECATRNDRRCE